jgi:gamma-glutamyl hydrolase
MGNLSWVELLAMMPEHIDRNYFKRLQLEQKFRLGTLTFTGPSKLRDAFPRALQRRVAVTPCVHHIHKFGFNVRAPHTVNLTRYLKIVSVDKADDGSEFMNMFEFKNYPFYGSQWHPEKPLTDLGVELSYTLSLFLKKECAHNKTVPPRWSKIFEPIPLDSPFTVLLRGGTTV